MKDDGTDFVMTVEQVSEYLQLAQSTIYKLAKERRIPARKVGGRWRFSRRALDGYLEGEPKEIKKPQPLSHEPGASSK